MKRTLFLILALAFTVRLWGGEQPKYIFYFIGDGMGINSVALTEACLASQNGDPNGFQPLNFSQFPVYGIATTYCSNRRTTDSAAAGTALASGRKTSVGTIGMDAEHKEPMQSIAVDAKKAGMRSGVATSVSIDHATPASFYAHQPDRNMYYEIAMDAPAAGLDLYAGSGFLKPAPEGKPSAFTALEKAGYRIVRGDRPIQGQRAVMIQEEGAPADALPLAIDAKPGDLTLQAITRRSIDFLSKDAPKGFFLMVEGGQIDWANHSNDAASTVAETKNFADAIGVALDFYKEHPDETLIVVTADHETGGVALGLGAHGYDTYFDRLSAQKSSQTRLVEMVKKTANWDAARALLVEQLGFGSVVGISDEEWKSLEAKYNKKPKSAAEAAVKLLDKQAAVAWTTGSHTATFVPVFAIGAGAEQFAGRQDNTDIANKLRSFIIGE